MKTDKMLHFSASYGITLTAMLFAGYLGSIGLAYTPRLHSWEATFSTLDIFPDGIPIQESAQKDTLYGFIKDYLNLSDVVDVFEDGDE